MFFIKNHINFNLGDEMLYVIHKNNDIINELRSEEIAKYASQQSSKKEVRDSLFEIQRNFYKGIGLVADGRDMGTVVFKTLFQKTR